MLTYKSPAEALAECWATMDGLHREFLAGRRGERNGGHYEGYMEEAEEIIRRLKKRGFELVKSA